MSARAQTMALTGAFAVSPSGAATYSIPIQVPPGIAGSAPQLAFTYNSQGGNGLLGWGWNLSGLSAISRCPQTMAQDGVRGAINFDLNDRFCLDGQRLILVSGVYGMAGSEYRTESDSFSQIKAYGTAGNGPAYFIVNTKSGQSIEYGNTADARIEAVKVANTTSIAAPSWQGTARVWAQNKVSDANGNSYTVSYTEDSVSGEYLPSTIAYASTTLLLDYEARPDVDVSYQTGSLVTSSKRLNRLRAQLSGDLVNDYRLEYFVAANDPNQFSKLAKISLCGADNTCVQDLKLSWPADASDLMLSGAPAIPQNSPHVISDVDRYMKWGDFNGDGKTDYMWVPMVQERVSTSADENGNTVDTWVQVRQNYWNVAYSTGNGFSLVEKAIPQISLPVTSDVDRYMKLGDFNGDGKTDYMWVPMGQFYWNVAYSTGTGFSIVEKAIPQGNTQVISDVDRYMKLGDFNGDGKTDYMWVPMGQYYWNVAYSTGNGFSIVEKAIPQSSPHAISDVDQYMFVADFNGDGKTDYMWVPMGQYYWNVAYSTGTGFSVVEKAIPQSSPHAISDVGRYMKLGDFNGDGKTDYMWVPMGQFYWNVAYSTGNGFSVVERVIPQSSLQVISDVDQYMFVADFNGDGKTDYMWVPMGQYYWNVAYATGTGFSVVEKAIPQKSPHVISDVGRYMKLGDFNGDGKTDYMWVPMGQFYWNVAYSTGTGFSVVEKVIPQSTPHAISDVDRYMFVADFNGDGKTDYMWVPLGLYYWNVAYSNPSSQLLKSIETGQGKTNISYSPLTAAGVYTKDTGPDAAVYPRIDLQTPMYVVTRAEKSNGVGGLNATTYSYGGLKAELWTGRGLLGFRWQKSKEEATGIESYSEYRQDWPFVGFAKLSETRLAGKGNAGVLKRVVAVAQCQVAGTVQVCAPLPANCNEAAAMPSCRNLSQSRVFVSTQSSVEQSWDVNGVAMPSISTSYVYGLSAGDTATWGDPTQVVFVMTDASGVEQMRKTTVNEYFPANTSNGNWILGRLNAASVTSSQP